MSHHKPISIVVGGARINIGYVRMTNDAEVISIWIDNQVQRQLFVPEVSE